ncbi:hypothetical protein EDB85DRAFT_1955616 [Lactarius pseudohatsudake]|nr:hypothetical protein EDB85DRAFT_1955616 [Lactarius pseudohatsudake]
MSQQFSGVLQLLSFLTTRGVGVSLNKGRTRIPVGLVARCRTRRTMLTLSWMTDSKLHQDSDRSLKLMDGPYCKACPCLPSRHSTHRLGGYEAADLSAGDLDDLLEAYVFSLHHPLIGQSSHWVISWRSFSWFLLMLEATATSLVLLLR